jgi:hypothetical protein
MEIVQKLSHIQSKLKAPKGQTNKFGGFKYRSCEDILEAVKPLLAEQEAYLKISDSIELVGDRYYVKATVRLCSAEEYTEATAYAREPLTKKGMDEAQITGATSSYARKYALNGLFCIDDTKDADTQDNKSETLLQMPKSKTQTQKTTVSTSSSEIVKNQQNKPAQNAPLNSESKPKSDSFKTINKDQYLKLLKVANEGGWTVTDVEGYIGTLGYTTPKEVNELDYEDIIEYFSKSKEARLGND